MSRYDGRVINISTCRGCPYCHPVSKPTFRQWLRRACRQILLIV